MGNTSPSGCCAFVIGYHQHSARHLCLSHDEVREIKAKCQHHDHCLRSTNIDQVLHMHATCARVQHAVYSLMMPNGTDVYIYMHSCMHVSHATFARPCTCVIHAFTHMKHV